MKIPMALRWTGTAALLAVALQACGCSKDTKPAAEEPKVPAQPEQGASTVEAPSGAAVPEGSPEPATAEAAPQAAGGDELKAKISEGNFDLSLEPKGEYAAGTEGTVEVVLVAKGPFKVNDEYPYKFKLQESEGVQFKDMVVKKDAVKLEKKRAVMTVGFTPQSAGKKSIAGQFSFSVCTDDKCLIEKRDLATLVEVK